MTESDKKIMQDLLGWLIVGGCCLLIVLFVWLVFLGASAILLQWLGVL